MKILKLIKQALYVYCFFPEGMAYQCLLKNELLGAGIEDLKVRPYNV